MRMTASWFRSLDLPHTRLWRDSTAPESGLPSDCHPDCIIVLEAVRMRLLDSKSPIQGCLTQKAPYKGLGAESEEKREPVSDIDTGVVDSLKALDPDGRLEKRTNSGRLGMSAFCPKGDIRIAADSLIRSPRRSRPRAQSE